MLFRSQDNNEFKPYFKPLALVFTNVHTSFNESTSSGAFEITRAYLGFEYFFTEKLSSRVNIDVGDPGSGSLEMTAFLKNAYLLYKNNGFSARFGMIGTDQYNFIEKHWGYRYIYKSFQDEYSFGPSADLGTAIEYSFSNFLTLDFSVLNGEGYKKLQSDNVFKTTFGATLRPLKGLTFRGYYDFMKDEFAQTSLSLFAGYEISKFRIGMEYNVQQNNKMVDEHTFSGISAYASWGLSDKLSLFTRYDNLTSEVPSTEIIPWNNAGDGQLYMLGMDYLITKGVKIAPNFRGWRPASSSEDITYLVALNFEIKF